MGLWTGIVLVVLIGAIANMYSARQRAKHGITQDVMGNETQIAPPNDAEKLMLKNEVAELRERIQVLERIATDGRQVDKLSAEIDQLRDKD